ncbi:MAG: histidinol-phosphate transaminase [Spirochaetales bacterium]|nr:histidinol-phosphate transaminase [Spirochaetales bacterium]
MAFKLEDIANPGILPIQPYIPGKSIQEVIREKGVTDVIKMASNENPLGISPLAYRAVKESLKNSFQYPEVSSMKLREALSGNLAVPPDYIMIGNGGDEIIYTLAMTFLTDNDEVIIPELTFSMYEIVTRAMRGIVVKSKVVNLRIDLDDILSKITDKTKIIFLCNPNNPSGDLLDKMNIYNFVSSVPENVIIMHDESYSEFADSKLMPNLRPFIKEGKKNIILLRTFSKIYGLAGIRVGYGIADPEMLSLMYRIRPPFGVSVPAQEAGAAALKDQQFFLDTLELTEAGKNYIYKELKRLNLSFVKSHTNFILIDTKRDCKIVSHRMISRGVIIRPMSSYNLPTFIRVTIGTDKQNERFIRALETVLNEVKPV